MNIHRPIIKVWMAGLLVCLVITLLGTAPAAVRAQGQNPVTLTAEAGFGGYCRREQWTPVRVYLANSGPDVRGTVRVQDTNGSASAAVFAQEVDLPNTSRKTVTLFAKLDRYYDTKLKVEWVSGNRTWTTDADVECVDPTRRMFGVIAETTTPFNELINVGVSNASGSTVVAFMSVEELPERAAALDSLDLLIIAGSDTGGLLPAQQEALAGWVSGGGHLIVSGGAEWQCTAAGLQELLPVEPHGSQTVETLGGLAALAGETSGLRGSSVVAQVTLREGARILAGDQKTPLVVAGAYGLGQVVYLAFDPSVQPFSNWAGREDFYRGVFAQGPNRAAWSWGFSNDNPVVDAASRLQNQGMPSAWLILAFMFLYVGVVGPGNYLVVRVLKKREMAWFTIPGVVLIFCVIAFLIGVLGRGGQVIVTRLAVLQSGPGASHARVDGVVSIFSPSRTSYTFRAGPDFLAYPIESSGGMSAEDQWELSQQPDGAVVDQDLRVDVAGIQSASVTGRVPAPDIHGELAMELQDSGMMLVGEVYNGSDVTLKDAVLLYPGGATAMGDINPGARQEVNVQAQAPMDTRPLYDARPSNGNGYVGTYYSPYASSPDDWTSTLSGTVDTYDASPEAYRRYQMIAALRNNTNFDLAAAPGAVYLAGWSDESLIDADLDGINTSRVNETLYLVRIATQVSAQDWTVFEPGMFTYQVLDQTPGLLASPYPANLSPGQFTLSYQPYYPLTYRSVEALTLHLSGGYNFSALYPPELRIDLWNFEKGDWQTLKLSAWGDYDLEDPARYVGPMGEIRLRVENTGSTSGATISLNRADFTLVVTP